jgi:peptidoglycan/xylan/chitin deacetylase (PgdA/CDA1 family)
VRAKRLLRRTALGAARTPFFGAFVAALDRADGGRADTFTVLLYHRIGEPRSPSRLDPSLISATPDGFEAQVAYLASRRHVLSLDELLAVRRGCARLPPRAVVVTFDDAYRDFAEHAWPALRRHRVPATLFVPTAYPDRPERAFWWDRLHAAVHGTTRPSVSVPWGTLPLQNHAQRERAFRTLSSAVKALEHDAALELVGAVEAELDVPPAAGAVLGWDELRRLAREGLALAPHTRTHPLLDRVDPWRLADEIHGSAQDLERELGAAPRVFAYPGGAHSPAVADAVRRAGYELAFTTGRGSNDAKSADWMRLRRTNVGVRASLAVVRVQLLSRPRRPRPALRAARA